VEGDWPPKVRPPTFEVAAHGLVTVVTVNPQQAHRHAPVGSDDLGGQIHEPHLLADSGREQVLEKGTSIGWAEPASHDANEFLVRLDRVNRDACSPGEGNRRLAPIASDLDDATVLDFGRQPSQKSFLFRGDH
jgi:hypothetical protein